MKKHKINMEDLRYSNTFYKALLEISNDSMVVIRVETGKVVDFNESTYRTLGYTKEEFKKLDIEDYDVYETKDRVHTHIERIVEMGRDHFITKQKTKDGKIIDVEINSRLIEVNKEKFIVSTWRDISTMKNNIHEKEQLIESLKTSITESGKLMKLLPICSYCKKIRDSQNTWEPLDVYLNKKTKYRFTHSICPECMKDKFPDYSPHGSKNK